MNRLPPGPGSTFVTGLKYLRDPYGILLETARRYGDPFSWPSSFGRMVVTGAPEGIRTLFTADPDTYLAIGAELLGPIIGESNLILLSGERHRAMRKLQLPPFHGARMRAYGQLILGAAEEHAARWPRDRPIRIHRTMQEISLQVILEAVLGLREPGPREAFKEAVLAVIAALKPSFMFIEALRRPLLGLSSWARFQKRRAHTAALFEAELRARRASSSESREDILSLLLAARYDDGSALTEDELLTQMMNLIVAGHETTASALAWCFHHLHREPAVKARLMDELRGLPEPLEPEAIARLPYLEAVCSEALRLDPVAPLIGRTLRKGLTLQGFDLPPGISVGISILQVHRRADLYPEPERFRPERFLERSYTPFEYLPFGGGARRCIGAAFALYEMKLVLAAILRKHDLRPVSDAPLRVAVRNTTVGPRGEVELVYA